MKLNWINLITFSRTEKGFTLIEVMFAIAIIGVGIGSVIIAENNSLNTTFRAKRMSTVAMLAKNALIEAERELNSKTFDEVKDEYSGKFDAPFAEYSWERKIKKITFPNLMESLASGGGGSAPAGGTAGAAGGASASGSPSFAGVTSSDDNITNVIKIATNYLSKSTREISITIKWKDKGEDQKFSVSQYWVDLKHEFNLSTTD